MRAELQEIKQDIDNELKTLEKLLKKQEEKLQQVDITNSQTSERVQVSLH